MANERPSASIRGAGEISGGRYRRLSIFGAGEVLGDIEAERLRVIGSGEIHGRADVTRLTVLGSGEIAADLVAGAVHATGSFEVGGELRAETLTVRGACDIDGRILADAVSMFGALECKDRIETATFRSRGAIDVDGLLSGDTVEIHLGGNVSRVGEIGGERIEVWRGAFGKTNPVLQGLSSLLTWGSRRGRLEADGIEADEIHLENTRAKVVRGRNVTVGVGCRIDEVEYAEGLTVHPSAHVTTKAKRSRRADRGATANGSEPIGLLG